MTFEEIYRQEWSQVVATLIRVTGDWELAEECAQEAFAAALQRWPQDGVPDKPGAWLTTTARRRALDLLRRDSTLHRLLPKLLVDEADGDPADLDLEAIPDDRLRLICTCCHPAIATEARVALTLRLVCGLSTADVARAFLVSEPTMAARITRAKKKIALARIPYRVPSVDELPSRLAAVLDVVHDWQEVFLEVLGHRLVFAADEYYLLANRPFPEPEAYEGFAMHEDGIGMARTFELEFFGRTAARTGPQEGFFAWVDGTGGLPAAPAATSRYEAAGDFDAPAEGYRAARLPDPAEVLQHRLRVVPAC